jgi:hypothetical protein
VPPQDPQAIIDDQRREIDRLREDLRRSEAERQRLRRENEKLKGELEAARRAACATRRNIKKSRYPGVLQRDGWQSYRQFHHAAHQTCLAHLLRRGRVLLLDSPAQPFVTAVKAILQAALPMRERYHAGNVSDHGLAMARGHYVERLGQLLQRTPSRRVALPTVSKSSPLCCVPPTNAPSMRPMYSRRCSPHRHPLCPPTSESSPQYTDPVNTDLRTPNRTNLRFQPAMDSALSFDRPY